MNEWLANLVPALVGLLGVVLGAWIQRNPARSQFRYKFYQRRLTELNELHVRALTLMEELLLERSASIVTELQQIEVRLRLANEGPQAIHIRHFLDTFGDDSLGDEDWAERLYWAVEWYENTASERLIELREGKNPPPSYG